MQTKLINSKTILQGQVNNILQNSQEAALQSQPVPKNPINSIRQATLEQLHKMGIGGVDEKNTCEKRWDFNFITLFPKTERKKGESA